MARRCRGKQCNESVLYLFCCLRSLDTHEGRRRRGGKARTLQWPIEKKFMTRKSDNKNESKTRKGNLVSESFRFPPPPPVSSRLFQPSNHVQLENNVDKAIN